MDPTRSIQAPTHRTCSADPDTTNMSGWTLVEVWVKFCQVLGLNISLSLNIVQLQWRADTEYVWYCQTKGHQVNLKGRQMINDRGKKKKHKFE